ncbi:MAG: hypothetical protein LKE40_13050 [Spirochaetia bacterium]|jgi:hypothetical protein|nr:hypothetical protein [Spirochaetia bacterium]
MKKGSLLICSDWRKKEREEAGGPPGAAARQRRPSCLPVHAGTAVHGEAEQQGHLCLYVLMNGGYSSWAIKACGAAAVRHGSCMDMHYR